VRREPMKPAAPVTNILILSHRVHRGHRGFYRKDAKDAKNFNHDETTNPQITQMNADFLTAKYTQKHERIFLSEENTLGDRGHLIAKFIVMLRRVGKRYYAEERCARKQASHQAEIRR